MTYHQASSNKKIGTSSIAELSFSNLKKQDEQQFEQLGKENIANKDDSSSLSSSTSSIQPQQQQQQQPIQSIFMDDHLPITNLNIISSQAAISKTTAINSSSSTQRQLNEIECSVKPATRTFNHVNDDLQHVHKQIQVEILKQLLKLRNISFDWFDTIISLAWQSVHLVRPDVKHDNDSMDIRSYIKIKKLPGAGLSKSDCRIVNGLVFSKNVAHKQMQQDVKTPKILLLKSSIEYQRTEEKMCSLEPILAAESQYLKNYCSKLLFRQNPDILVVEKSVARIAQEVFLQAGVSLVLNVKSSIMDKLARFLQADPMHSIDDPVKC